MLNILQIQLPYRRNL